MIETIKQLLMAEQSQARVTLGDAWLVYDEINGLWVIYQKKYGQRKVRKYAEVETEFDAVRKLIHSQE